MTENNRGFLYGDGFFETIRIENGTCPLLSFHIERAKQTARYFEMQWENHWDENFFLKQIKDNNTNNDNVVRIDFYRLGEGQYMPLINDIGYHLSFRTVLLSNPIVFHTSYDLQQHIETLNQTPPRKVAIYSEILKPTNDLSKYKLTSAMFYIKAGLYLKTLTDTEDLILCNDANRICEGLSSNIVAKRNNVWVTIPVSEGPVEGVYQKYLSSLMDMRYETISIEEFHQFDQIYFCNAVTGLVQIALS